MTHAQTATVTYILMRNAMEALGGSEAIRERWRLGGGDDLPADATPLAADHFRGAVHELFLRGEESLLVTLVAAFAEGLGDAPGCSVWWSCGESNPGPTAYLPVFYVRSPHRRNGSPSPRTGYGSWAPLA